MRDCSICLVAPLAVILGVVALIDISKHPERHGRGRAIFGIVMGSIFSIGLFILVVLIAPRLSTVQVNAALLTRGAMRASVR